MTGSVKHPALPFLRSPEKGKVVTADEAVRLIHDGDTVATGGFVGIGFAEEIAIALEERFLARARRRAGQPARSDARLCGGAGRRQGPRASTISPMRAWSAASSAAIGGSRRSCRRWRSTTSSRPTTCRRASSRISSATSRRTARPISRGVGMETFVDPRNGGGKLNARTTEELVERVTHRRRGMPRSTSLPDPCRHHPRHHRRRGRQPDHGEGGADARGAGHRHGGAQFRRHRYRPGRARRRERQPQPAAGQDPRHPGRLRGRRQARKPLADFRHRSTIPPIRGEIRARAGRCRRWR